jgi:hypothetical protein
VSSGSVYGSHVDTDELALTLEKTRVLRLALNVLYDGMDEIYEEHSDAAAMDRFRDTLAEVHQHLCAAETRALALCGFAEHYVVIRPFSPARPPEPEAVKEVTAAVRTLAGHGMLVQAPDALGRDITG